MNPLDTSRCSRRRVRLWLLAPLVIVTVAAACGNDDTTQTATTTTTTAATTTTTTGVPAPETTVAEEAPTTGYDPATWPLPAVEMSLPATFVDASGNESTIERADRIGSLSGAASELLWTLGYGDRIVVIDGTTRYPAELASLPNVGFFRTIPAEGVLAQSPDVLFVPLDAGPPEALEAIAAAGVVVVRLPIDSADPASLQATADLMGRALGIADHARALSDGVLRAFASASVEVAEDAPVVAYAVARGQNVFLTGLDNPSNAMISAAGFRTAAGELGLTAPAPITPEALVVVDPAVIVTTRSSVMQAGGEDAFLATPGIAQSQAGRRRALVIWEDDQSIQLWTPRAPQTVMALMEQITAAVS